MWGEEEEVEKSADETERGYSRGAIGDGEIERFEEGGQNVLNVVVERWRM